MSRLGLIFVTGLILAGSARAQLGPCAAPQGADLPDLIVDRRALQADKFLTAEFVDTNSCELVEGCVPAAGLRQLLRFTTLTPNIGAAALVIGDPSQCPLLYHFSECHGHYHLEQYADYRFWTPAGFKFWKSNRDTTAPVSNAVNASLLQSLQASGDLITGRKQGFCMLDSSPWPTKTKHPKSNAFGDCINNQGISAGWADVYDASLDCQFVDVTGAPPGKYILEVEVNPDHILPEANYLNNSARVHVRIPKP